MDCTEKGNFVLLVSRFVGLRVLSGRNININPIIKVKNVNSKLILLLDPIELINPNKVRKGPFSNIKFDYSYSSYISFYNDLIYNDISMSVIRCIYLNIDRALMLVCKVLLIPGEFEV